MSRHEVATSANSPSLTSFDFQIDQASVKVIDIPKSSYETKSTGGLGNALATIICFTSAFCETVASNSDEGLQERGRGQSERKRALCKSMDDDGKRHMTSSAYTTGARRERIETGKGWGVLTVIDDDESATSSKAHSRETDEMQSDEGRTGAGGGGGGRNGGGDVGACQAPFSKPTFIPPDEVCCGRWWTIV